VDAIGGELTVYPPQTAPLAGAKPR